MAILEIHEGWRHLTFADNKASIVTGPAKGDGSSPSISGCIARRAVHGTEMEGHAIAGFQSERDDVVFVAFGLYIGHVLESLVIALIVDTDEFSRREPAAPLVRSPNEFNGPFPGHRVQGDPQTHIVVAIDAVIRLVVVPRRPILGPRFGRRGTTTSDPGSPVP